MEAPQLRPLGVGDIVDRVFALYRMRPLLFLALSAVPYLLFVLVTIGAGVMLVSGTAGLKYVTEALAQGDTPPPGVLVGILLPVLGFVLFLVVAAVVILSAQTAALVYAMSARYLGRTITLGQAFSAGLRAAPRVIGTGLLLFLAIVALWAALVVAIVLVRDVNGAPLLVAGAIFLGIVGTFYLFASTLVAPVVATIEHAGPMLALRRSWSLSAGNRWRIIGVQMLLLVLNVVISGLVSVIFLTTLIADAGLRTAAQQLTNAATTIAWAPVEWGTFAILYYDLRVRREAFDLQLAAEALPRAP